MFTSQKIVDCHGLTQERTYIILTPTVFKYASRVNNQMYERVEREDVVRALSTWGPLQPLEVRRKLGKGETTMIGAVLSELAHHKRVAITKMKRGSSPFYYLPDKVAGLERVAQYLGEKDKRTYDLLKEKRVIDPATVDPLTRVSLGNIPDFSKPFEHDGKEYYRYFLTSEDEAKELLKPKPAPQPAPKPAPKATPAKEQKKPEKTPRKKTKKSVEPTGQQTLKTNNDVDADDEFLKRVVRYCNNKKLVIISHDIIRKKQEIDLVVTVPTAVGKINYFCKAKSKKKSNDGDVAGALLAAQRHQLPAMYLTTGEVTKKAKEMPELKGVLIKEIKP